MADWYNMPVKAKKIDDNNNLIRFTVGGDVIEMYVILSSSYFQDLRTEVVKHYIRSPENIVQNYNRTLALRRRILDYLQEKYLEELKNVFHAIASEPTGKLTKTFTCLDWDFNEYSKPEDVFWWFSKRYSYYRYFNEVAEPLKEKEGFLQKEIRSFLNC